MSWPADLQAILSDYYRTKAKLTNWTGVMGNQALEDGHDENMRNREAESAAVRRQLWGSNESGGEPDEMRQTILGDITHPAPIIMPQPQQQSPWLPITLAAAAGLGGYALANRQNSPPSENAPPAAIEFQDETISVGLGRIQDYMDVQK
jgi:hypothetical protein